MYSQNQMRILGLFFAHPGEEFYLSQIGEALDKRPGLFQRGINAMEEKGVLSSRKRGNQRLFSVNEKYPLINEIRSIIGKTVGVEAMVRDFAASFAGIQIALIYGSYAKDSLRPGSDIDLLLVVTKKDIQDVIIGRLQAIERGIQREVNFTMYTLREYKNKRAANDPFLDDILGGKFILLKGNV